MPTIFGLIGKTLSHSFSKAYFTSKFQHLRLYDFSYELWEIECLNTIRSFIQQKKYVRGFNITIPYKEEIIKYLDVVSDEVLHIGACNCVHIQKDVWIGYNTDWWGFVKMIENKLEPHHTAALILGTGGAAKAIAYGLQKLQIDYLFVSRQIKNTLTPCITYTELTHKHFEEYPIIINTTPLGMYPNIHVRPAIPMDFIDEKNFVIDINYNPLKTQLLMEAEKHQAKILNGLEMLYLQAEKSWYIWQKDHTNI